MIPEDWSPEREEQFQNLVKEFAKMGMADGTDMIAYVLAYLSQKLCDDDMNAVLKAIETVVWRQRMMRKSGGSS